MRSLDSFYALRNPVKTIASDILELINSAGGFIALTLNAGYGMPYRGNRILFTPGHEVKVNRNANHRVTSATYEYDDGSRILFTWSELIGPRYQIAPIKRIPCAA